MEMTLLFSLRDWLEVFHMPLVGLMNAAIKAGDQVCRSSRRCLWPDSKKRDHPAVLAARSADNRYPAGRMFPAFASISRGRLDQPLQSERTSSGCATSRNVTTSQQKLQHAGLPAHERSRPGEMPSQAGRGTCRLSNWARGIHCYRKRVRGAGSE